MPEGPAGYPASSPMETTWSSLVDHEATLVRWGTEDRFAEHSKGEKLVTVSTIINKLHKKFRQEELEWRPGKAEDRGRGYYIQIMPYVDARAIFRRLDDAVGPMNWKTAMTGTERGVICTLSLDVGDGRGWVSREDAAGYRPMPHDHEIIKGACSDAIKRAANQWGVGQYLYEMGRVYADVREGKDKPDRTWNKYHGKDLYWRPKPVPAEFLPARPPGSEDKDYVGQVKDEIAEIQSTHKARGQLTALSALYKRVDEDEAISLLTLEAAQASVRVAGIQARKLVDTESK